jgi:hypothetical protein
MRRLRACDHQLYGHGSFFFSLKIKKAKNLFLVYFQQQSRNMRRRQFSFPEIKKKRRLEIKEEVLIPRIKYLLI